MLANVAIKMNSRDSFEKRTTEIGHIFQWIFLCASEGIGP